MREPHTSSTRGSIVATPRLSDPSSSSPASRSTNSGPVPAKIRRASSAIGTTPSASTTATRPEPFSE